MSRQINEYGIVVPYNRIVEAGGTSLIGEITVNYADLKALFGYPSDGDGYKTDAEWVIQTPAGAATIYNYKDGVNYLGSKDGLPKTKIMSWHIGGQNVHAYAWVCFAILRA